MAELEIKPTAMMRFRVFAIVWLAFCFCALLVYLLTGGRGEAFAATTSISTWLPDATGVSMKTPVRLDGIQIGTVSHVQLSGRLDPQRAVYVQMTVKRRYLRDIPRDSTTAINADTLIGDKFIDINEGKSAAPLGDDSVLESEPVRQASDRADLIHALEGELRQVDTILATVSDPNSPLGHFIVGEAEYDAFLVHLKEFDTAVRSFVSPQSPVGQMLFTNAFYDGLHTNAVRVDQQLAAIQNGEGTAGHLFASDQQYEDLARDVRGLRDSLGKLNSGQGRAGALLQSDAAYDRVTNALKRMNALLASPNAGEGQFGHLLRDPQLYESLNGTLRSLEEAMRDFRENPRKYLRYQVRGRKRASK